MGRSIARELLANGHQVILMTKTPARYARTGSRSRLDSGDACELASLEKVRLKEGVRVVISATGDDKVNLVVSLLPKTRPRNRRA